MTRHAGLTIAAFAALAVLSTSLRAEAPKADAKAGKPDVKSAGPLAFGPDGVLFLADPKAAAVFAIETGDADEGAKRQAANVAGIDKQIAAALGTSPDQIQINDLAVNPASGTAYLSVSRGLGPDADPVLLRVAGGGKIEEVPLDDVKFSKITFDNAPADQGEGRRNQRQESITDLAFLDGRLVIAGLSNEEFASKLRAVSYPFSEVDSGTSVEIYHGSHGGFETRSPIRTFLPLAIDGKAHLVAAYTCTPLVTFPVDELKSGAKVRGTTVAELGNRNRPLDMVSYTRDGKSYILMANNARGVMRIPVEGLGDADAIEQRVPDKAGVGYETVADLEGVTQLDRLDDDRIVVITQKDGRTDLATVDTP